MLMLSLCAILNDLITVSVTCRTDDGSEGNYSFLTKVFIKAPS